MPLMPLRHDYHFHFAFIVFITPPFHCQLPMLADALYFILADPPTPLLFRHYALRRTLMLAPLMPIFCFAIFIAAMPLLRHFHFHYFSFIIFAIAAYYAIIIISCHSFSAILLFSPLLFYGLLMPLFR
jgi:hypothetical protein